MQPAVTVARLLPSDEACMPKALALHELDGTEGLLGKNVQVHQTWNALLSQPGKEESPGMIHTILNVNGNVAVRASCR